MDSYIWFDEMIKLGIVCCINQGVTDNKSQTKMHFNKQIECYI